ncbi:MAG: hypothetical protein ACREGF_02965, partial [Candidatus Saccharimonadales bacterium]
MKIHTRARQQIFELSLQLLIHSLIIAPGSTPHCIKWYIGHMPSKQKYDTLLIIIDLQKGWIHKTATEATMLRAAALAEKFDGDVIHCRFWNNPDSLFHKQLQWKRFTENYDTEEIPEIAKLKLPTYWRDTYSVINDETLPII